jgi:integrase
MAWKRYDTQGFKYLYGRDTGGFAIRRPKPKGTLNKQGKRDTNLTYEPLEARSETEAFAEYERLIGKDPVVGAEKAKRDEPFANVWKNYIERHNTLAASSVDKHKSTARYIEQLMHGPISGFDKDWVNNALNVAELHRTAKGEPLSPSTLKSVLALCQALGSYCVAEGHLDTNPAQDLRRRSWMVEQKGGSRNVVEHREVEAHEVVSDEEVEQIVAALGDYDENHVFIKQVAVKLWVEVGPRIREMLALGLEHIKDDEPGVYGDAGCLLIERQLSYAMKVDDPSSWFARNARGKYVLKAKGKARRVPLSPTARNLLDTYIKRGRLDGWLSQDDSGLLFPNPETGQPYTPGMFGKAISTAAEDGGIDRRITSHHLRHTYISRLLQAGLEISEVAGYAGNSPAVTEAVYAHFISMAKRANRVAQLMEAARRERTA